MYLKVCMGKGSAQFRKLLLERGLIKLQSNISCGSTRDQDHILQLQFNFLKNRVAIVFHT